MVIVDELGETMVVVPSPFSQAQRKQIHLNTETRICCKITTSLYKITEFLVGRRKKDL